MDRGVRIIYGVGQKTAETLQRAGISTVGDILRNKQTVIRLLDNQGRHIIDLAEGSDERRVMPHYETEAKSLGKEYTFQQDTTDLTYLKGVLRLIAKDLSLKIRFDGLYIRTVTLKVKFANMKLITRSKTGDIICRAKDIYNVAASLLDTVERCPIRLVGISLSGFTDSYLQQLTIDDILGMHEEKRQESLDHALLKLQRRYGGSIIKTGDEMIAEKRFGENEGITE
jgi:DNA polymerase-4